MKTNTRWHLLIASTVVLLAGAHLPAQTTITFTALASVKAPGKSGTMPVTIKIDRFISDAERDKLAVVVKGNKSDETLKALAAMPDIGTIQLGETAAVPLKYAYARSTGAGRLVTVVTAKPLLFLPGDSGKPKAGFDLGLALLVLNESGAGDGELTPAAKVRVDEKGAIVTEGHSAEVVRLLNVARAK